MLGHSATYAMAVYYITHLPSIWPVFLFMDIPVIHTPTYISVIKAEPPF